MSLNVPQDQITIGVPAYRDERARDLNLRRRGDVGPILAERVLDEC